MADWSKPDLLSTEAEYTSEIKARDEDLAKQFDGTTSTNLPDGTIRWNSVNKLWEKLVSGVWGALCDVYNIVVSRAQQADNADKVDGLEASQFLRSDADDSFTGTLSWAKDYGDVLKLDSGFSYAKRVSVNDGQGNLNIALNWSGSNTHLVGGGAARISLDGEGLDGQIRLRVSPNQAAGSTVSETYLKVSPGSLIFNGQKVWHAGNDGPGTGLHADLVDGAHATSTPTANAIPIADSSGKLAVGWIPDTIPAGTRMLFGSVPPPGWTLVTDFHDRVLRIVNNTTDVGLTGGGWSITGLSASTTVSVAGHALTIDEMPPHSHTCVHIHVRDNDSSTYSNTYEWSGWGHPSILEPTTTVGGGQEHSHGATASTTLSHDGSWRPAYLNIVMAEKS